MALRLGSSDRRPLPFVRVNPASDRHARFIRTIIGMQPEHAVRLLDFANGAFRGRRLILMVRASNPLSLQYHGLPNHVPKPPTFKPKIGESGRTPMEAPAQGYYISDYDLHGVYEHRGVHTMSTGQQFDAYSRFYVNNHVDVKSVQIGSATAGRPDVNPFLKALNAHVCPGPQAFFQHGADDDYRAGGRSAHELEGRDPAIGRHHLVVEHTGNAYLLRPAEVVPYLRYRRLSVMPGW
jgi:hypothetical protein